MILLQNQICMGRLCQIFLYILVVSYHIPHRADGYVGELLSLLRMPAFS